MLLLRSVLAELLVLLDGQNIPHLQDQLIQMMVCASCVADNLQGKESDAPAAGDEDLLSLLLTMVLPAVQHAAAAATADLTADTAAGEQCTGAAGLAQRCLQTVCALINRALPTGQDDSVFDSQLFLQHPAAALSGLEAAVRHEVCDKSGAPVGSAHHSIPGRLAAWLLEQAERSAGPCTWLQQAVSPQAAGSRAAREAGANCSRLLCLLVACTKGLHVLAEQGDTDSSYWQLVAAEGALGTGALTNRLLAAAGLGAAGSGGGSDGVQQQLLSGLGHLLGRNLAAAGSMLAGALPPSVAAGANNEPAPTATAAGPAAQQSGPGIFLLLPQLLVIVQGLQAQVPMLSGAGHSQRQLLKHLETLAAAVAAVQSLWSSPAARAEAEAAASADAGDTRAVQLWLLRLNPAVAQQLVDALVGMGGVLCAALPTKHACNDPASACCDKASEQQLVGGKGSMCSACRVARYCCVEHQHRHWKAHKPACRACEPSSGGGGGQASSSSSKEKKFKAGGDGSSSSRRGG